MIRRLVVALVVVVAGCTPSPPPPVESTGLTGVMPGVAYQPGTGMVCEAQLDYDIDLVGDSSAQVVSKATTWGSCPFAGWLFTARLVCEPGCGAAGIPAGYYPAATFVDFTRVPDFGHLRVELWASYAGHSDAATKDLPTMRCRSGQCYFQG